MKKLINYISEAFYPSGIKCIVCDCELSESTRYGLCSKCRLPANDSYCSLCGRPVPEQNAVCDRCREHPLSFGGARSCFEYGENAASLVKRLKYGNARYLAPYMAEFMTDVFYSTDWEIDIITCVPIHRSRQRLRGYNQSELLAAELSKRIKTEFCNLLVKKVKTKNMAKLNREQRQELIKDSFCLAQSRSVKSKTVLLVDDVLTTGATASECASVLLSGGARQVYVLTFASVRQRPHLAEGKPHKIKRGIKPV